MKKRNAGIKVHFNPKNMYGEPCCCQKGYDTKFVSSTIYCVICNLFKLRARFKCSSWCKKMDGIRPVVHAIKKAIIISMTNGELKKNLD